MSSHSRSSSSSSSPPHSYPPARRSRASSSRTHKLPPSMLAAVSTFTSRVGPPRHVQPAGFRDFRGWLLRLNSSECHHVWDELFNSVAAAAGNDAHAIQLHKVQIVRSIVRMVVKPRADESSKLVSTNAGRQANKPRGSGSTLMSVLDEQLKRWQRGASMSYSSSSSLFNASSSSSPQACASSSAMRASLSPPYARTFSPIGKRARSSQHPRSPPAAASDRLPSLQQLLSGASASHSPLPSFQQLSESISRHNSRNNSRHNSPPPSDGSPRAHGKRRDYQSRR
eukprot:TRINITY_DN41030_c0_g1_i1.p1 TRINITY_DN41030_c0_g1~~TRINITY_DN41030_c0_g1_i1.p1  ORF type:complete len:299 (-),score=66.23 TRINITY_DN41030_c0_g1_i1:309-1157(-)